MSSEVRFGVTVDGRYSQRWVVRAMADRPDVYVMSQRTGRFLHLSLHDPAYGIHVKVNLSDGTREHRYSLPMEVVPGVRRIAQIIVPPSMATYDGPPRRGVIWVAGDDPEIWISFDIVAEEPGSASRAAEWNRATELVGRIERSDGGTVTVVASLTRSHAGSLSFTPVSGTADAARQAAEEGRAHVLIHGKNADGSISFLELRAETPSNSADQSGNTNV